MARKHYDERKIARTKARLVSNAGYVKPTAEAEDLAQETVRRWEAGDIPKHIDPAKLEQMYAEEAKELSNKLSRLATSALDRAAEVMGDLKSAKDAAITAAIAIDKAQLLRGKPTERTEVLDFASWLRSQRTASGTTPRPEPAKTEERVADLN